MSASLGDSQLLLKTIDGQQLFVRQNLPVAPAAILVIVHGLGGHQGRYDYMAFMAISIIFLMILKPSLTGPRKTRRICRSLWLDTVWAAVRRWHLAPNIPRRSMALFR